MGNVVDFRACKEFIKMNFSRNCGGEMHDTAGYTTVLEQYKGKQMTKEKEQKGKKPLKPINYKESPKERATKELSPEMVAQGLRKWLMDDKRK